MMNRRNIYRKREAGRKIKSLLLACGLAALAGSNVHAEGDAEAGSRTFLMFCSGCHGTDGFAEYEYAPSFSMGERLQKDDRELLQSVIKGINNMPPWGDKLPVQDLRNAIAYIRQMHERNLRGEAPLQADTPVNVYRFKPVGEQNMDWKAKESGQ